MARRKRFTAEQIIHKLREADVLIGQGVAVPEVSRRLAVSDQIAGDRRMNVLDGGEGSNLVTGNGGGDLIEVGGLSELEGV